MTAKTPILLHDMKRHLEQQLGFLERSADSFDAGFEDEAKRLALTIRLLVHDTKNSTSLLSHLNMKNIDFIDTGENIDANDFPQATLVHIHMANGRARYVAPLDECTAESRPFKEWWEKVIFMDRVARSMTRKDLVLKIANKDGGAHVDAQLDSDYFDLSKRNSLATLSLNASGVDIIEGAECVTIRQIAHEVLRTLKPTYNPRRMFSHERHQATSSGSDDGGQALSDEFSVTFGIDHLSAGIVQTILIKCIEQDADFHVRGLDVLLDELNDLATSFPHIERVRQHLARGLFEVTMYGTAHRQTERCLMYFERIHHLLAEYSYDCEIRHIYAATIFNLMGYFKQERELAMRDDMLDKLRRLSRVYSDDTNIVALTGKGLFNVMLQAEAFA